METGQKKTYIIEFGPELFFEYEADASMHINSVLAEFIVTKGFPGSSKTTSLGGHYFQIWIREKTEDDWR